MYRYWERSTPQKDSQVVPRQQEVVWNKSGIPILPSLVFCRGKPAGVEQYLGDILQLDVEEMFLPSSLQIAGGNVHYLKSIYGPPFFSKDITQGIHEGGTVTYVCLQLAYMMGFSTVLLVGVDHRYEYQGMPNEQQMAVGPDPNHFSPDYFTG